MMLDQQCKIYICNCTFNLYLLTRYTCMVTHILISYNMIVIIGKLKLKQQNANFSIKKRKSYILR